MANKTVKRVLITPVFTLSYPEKLFKPEPFKENGVAKGDPVYTAELIFPTASMDKFNSLNEETGEFAMVSLAAVSAELAREVFPGLNLKQAFELGALSWPIKDGDKLFAEKGEKGSHYEGTKVVNVKAKQEYPPKLYYMDGKVRKIADRTTDSGMSLARQKFYAGAQCIAEITVVSGTAGTNKYVTAYVNSVRFVKDGERIGSGSLMDRFDGINGGVSDIDPTDGMDDEIPF